MKKRNIISKALSFLLVAMVILCTACTNNANKDKETVANDEGNVVINKITGGIEYEKNVNLLNQNLVTKKNPSIPEHQELGVIIEMKGILSLADRYTKQNFGYLSLNDYALSKSGMDVSRQLIQEQNALADQLIKNNIILSVEHQYTTIMNGIYVRMKYGNLARLLNYDVVGKITLSQTYALPKTSAVKNDVNAYATGIFDSSGVSYTGKGTVVAVLDSGFDYTHSAYQTMPVGNTALNYSDINERLTRFTAYGLNENSLRTSDVYLNTKIPFAYDYADKDPEVMPYDSEHGTHVAAIIGGKDSVITGVAVDTQFALMKVFSDIKEGAETGDILAALEDSVILNVDVINMSLGSSVGFAREEDEEYVNTVYDSIETAGISLVVAASNDYSSGYGSEVNGNLNKTSNPDSGTVGSPASYHAALSVASINGQLESYFLGNGSDAIFFIESSNMAGKENSFYKMLYEQLGLSATGEHKFEYVTIPGIGLQANYSGLDVRGKIALVKRGTISFEDKMRYATEAGAIACIIYNNISGDIRMTVGNNITIPTVSISQVQGESLAKKATGELRLSNQFVAGPFMSDFSSWGPIPSLELKPEITAHGGNILSAVLSGQYDSLSGTSMASPNMAGVIILVRQYVKDTFPQLNSVEVNNLVNQLVMSTATIALNYEGNAYSPRKQGAGLADLVKAVNTKAYAYVENNTKTKLELFDDKEETGIYNMTFHIKNISDQKITYDINAIVMTEGVIGEVGKETVTESSIYLRPIIEVVSVEGGTNNNGIVSINGSGDAKVTLRVTLSDIDKLYLRKNFAYGMYVEGFVTMTNKDSSGIDLNIPFLAFFGDWNKAPMFDKTYYEVQSEAYDGSIDEEDKLQADYYATTPLGQYLDEYIIPLGSYIYNMDESRFDMIPATEDKIAMSYDYYSVHGIYAIYAGLLRAAKEMQITITETSTGKVIYQHVEYNVRKAYFGGGVYPGFVELKITPEELGLTNNSQYQFSMTGILDYEDDGTTNVNNKFDFNFFIDYEAPRLENATYSMEYDRLNKTWKTFLELEIYDNHYAMAIRPGILVENTDTTSSYRNTFYELEEYAIPLYGGRNGITKVKLEITKYLDRIYASTSPNTIAIYVDDYALNTNVYVISLPNTALSDLTAKNNNITADVGEVLDLRKNIDGLKEINIYNMGNLLQGEDLTNFLSNNKIDLPYYYYLSGLKWKSSNESVAIIHQGQLEIVGSGTTTITAETPASRSEFSHMKTGSRVTFTVTANPVAAPSPKRAAGNNVTEIEEVYLASYDTLFAFPNGDDYSEIGKTDSVNYLGSNPSISFYPSEKVKLNPIIKPWNLDSEQVTIKWTSSNPRIATVKEDTGVVEALEEGTATITLTIYINGKASFQTARCRVTVKNPFIVEGRILTGYKGNGGVVVIPDNLGIYMINNYAFSLYRERNIHPDDDNKETLDPLLDPEDFDARYFALGNNSITKVIIPKGVEIIGRYAFYNCPKLEEVVLGEDVTTINEMAFKDCISLKTINLDKVRIVGYRAFENNKALTGINTNNISTIGMRGFAGCTSLASLDLTHLRSVGSYAFADTTNLTSVTFADLTILSEYMFYRSGLIAINLKANNIPSYAFSENRNLESVVFENNVYAIGLGAFNSCSRLETVTFEGSIENIYQMAFNGCSNISSITLPNNAFVLENNVFDSCTLLSTVNFQKNTQIINLGKMTFARCAALTTFNVDAQNPYYSVNENKNMLLNADKTKVILGATGYNFGALTFDSSINEIGEGAFSGNTKITSVNLTNIEIVGKYAFSGATYIVSITITNEIGSIEEGAFENCSRLATINGLDNLSVISSKTFYNTAVTQLVFNNNNVVLEKEAFANTIRLTSVTVADNAVIGENAFYGSSITSFISGNNLIIKDRAFQNSSLSSIDLTKATEIGTYAFAATRLTTINLGSLAIVKEGAFMGSRLTQVTMNSVIEVEDRAFLNCRTLNTVNSTNLEFIGNEAFANTNLMTINTIAVSSVGDYAFQNCIYLSNVNLSSIQTIGKYAFSNSDATTSMLATVTLSNDITLIEEYSFYNNAKLTTINLANIEKIDNYAFAKCILLTNVNLNKVEYLGAGAFLNTKAFRNIELNEVEYIGESCFENSNIETVLMPKVVYIAKYAFSNSKLTEVNLPNTLEVVEKQAFFYISTFKEFKFVDNNDHFVIDEGVLYSKTDNYQLMLLSYPMGKISSTYQVLNETVKIEYAAGYGNPYLEEINFAYDVKTIGDFAFASCRNLKRINFKSYNAPIFEGTKVVLDPTYTGTVPRDLFDLYSTYSDIQNNFNASELFKYGVFVEFLYYSNFVDYVGKKNVSLNITYPQNGLGYENVLYKLYFKNIEKTSEVVMNANVWFILYTLKNMNSDIDKYSTELDNLLGEVRTLYNATMYATNTVENATQKAYITNDVTQKLVELETRMNQLRPVAKIALQTPAGFQISKSNKVSFSSVDNANGYAVRIVYENGRLEFFAINSGDNISKYLKTGENKVSICAYSNTTYADSAFTEEIILTVENNNNSNFILIIGISSICGLVAIGVITGFIIYVHGRKKVNPTPLVKEEQNA